MAMAITCFYMFTCIYASGMFDIIRHQEGRVRSAGQIWEKAKKHGEWRARHDIYELFLSSNRMRNFFAHHSCQVRSIYQEAWTV
jgi:hypothetical protein